MSLISMIEYQYSHLSQYLYPLVNITSYPVTQWSIIVKYCWKFGILKDSGLQVSFGKLTSDNIHQYQRNLFILA